MGDVVAFADRSGVSGEVEAGDRDLVVVVDRDEAVEDGLGVPVTFNQCVVGQGGVVAVREEDVRGHVPGRKRWKCNCCCAGQHGEDAGGGIAGWLVKAWVSRRRRREGGRRKDGLEREELAAVEGDAVGGEVCGSFGGLEEVGAEDALAVEVVDDEGGEGSEHTIGRPEGELVSAGNVEGGANSAGDAAAGNGQIGDSSRVGSLYGMQDRRMHAGDVCTTVY